jgi:hypothetical protein
VTYFLQVFPAMAAMLLELYLVFLLLRGPFRKYPIFFVYILGQLIGNSLEAFAFYHFGHDSSSYRTFYWSDEITGALLLFLVVITFTYEALRDNPLRPKAGKILATIAVSTLAYTFLLFHIRLFTYRWYNSTDQMLNFGAAGMNLVLWGSVLANRRRDPQLLTISMGVGIAATSAAVVWGARLWVSDPNRWPLDTFAVLMHVASLLLWCWVFRPKPTRGVAPPKPATTVS